jgi:nucleoside diphosphate kinase
MFSKTGVRIVGIKIHQMSVTEAQEFYRPLRASLREKFSRTIGRKAADLLEKKFSVPLSDASVEALSESFGKAYAEDQFQQVIEFMSGRRPDACPPEEIDVPGSVKTMLLIYEGENAQKKIREVLGPTDPLKAPSGTIRREFGSNIMVNAAHASNSVENAAREMDVLKVTENCCASIIRDYLSSAEPDLYRA